MKVAVSILSIKENIEENIEKLNQTTMDYLHLDIMDGEFVSNKTYDIEKSSLLASLTEKPKDVHLMVNDLDRYINDFSTLNPTFITFHFEATNDVGKYITLLKEKNIKVGISIKPDTDILVLEPYLKDLDLVLVMSVEPGAGGQMFMDSCLEKISWLKEQKLQKGYSYLIEVDGGINNETAVLVKQAGADMVVSGSFVTSSNDYQKQIEILQNCEKSEILLAYPKKLW